MTKLLLVEDDPFFADLLLSDLRDLFPHGELKLIGPAENFQDAITLIQSEKPDMALLDINLGSTNDLSGIRIAEFLNRTHPIPIIFISGLPQGFDRAKYTLPVAFLRKPYRKQDLADQLELLMVRHSMESRLKFEPETTPKSNGRNTLFVTVNRGEMVPLHLDQLLLLEADGKVIKAHCQHIPYPIVFTSPGLKNFFEEHQTFFKERFFQVSRKHVVNISQISRIKDNHIFIQKTSPSGTKAEFKIPFPANSDSKKNLLEILSGSQS
ncbi:response regulator [Algoriphagus aestuariicola]|uniref:Response regulator n=1 Tax=Algoriphagus aestuariicola TaxID=1852016 RepID=A0ABS3BQK0_9BACT|nr:response regulator [Algoriphagus aestuariicola]MBN7801181.1 response regulator [Algoriphagus aestuariicola]